VVPTIKANMGAGACWFVWQLQHKASCKVLSSRHCLSLFAIPGPSVFTLLGFHGNIS
jgi:hypothetical protein